MSERSIDNIRQDWQNKFKEANGACFWEPDPINREHTLVILFLIILIPTYLLFKELKLQNI